MPAAEAATQAELPAITTDLPLSQFRHVEVQFKDQPGPTCYVIHARDVRQFIEATVELHHFPGTNPHSGRKARPILEINACFFRASGPFWWSTPGLGIHAGGGATIMNEGMRTHRWSPDGGPKGSIWTAVGQ